MPLHVLCSLLTTHLTHKVLLSLPNSLLVSYFPTREAELILHLHPESVM